MARPDRHLVPGEDVPGVRQLDVPGAGDGLRQRAGGGGQHDPVGAGTDDADPRLLSIPVRVNPEMPRLTGMLIDPTAIVSAVSDLVVDTSKDTYFKSDSIAVRAVMRTGHTVVRPDRIGLFYVDGHTGWVVTLGSPASGTFTLTWRGKTTAGIAYNATAAAVKSALVALDDNYTADDWAVTGATGGPYTVTAPGGGALTGSSAGLTGGTFSIAAAV